ncbi:hypothetical protein [Leptospira noguchii]|uniref:hypothetical protein n=1 Tax=Leptospira noguchii TaxID=28182 RepID=UPI001FB5B40D|nr:hypothetical protein [Leptospira noguchii]UOG51619.1 hypothetical protein MAL09_13070 [Leptospira noguchii]
MPILREAFAELPGSLCRVALTKAKRFLNSASHSPWVVRQVALTQQNASYGSR